MKIFHLSTLALAMSTLFSTAHAETTASSDVVEAPDLATIVVVASPFSQQMGTQKVTAEQIETYPTRNGTITEFLKYNPNVTFSNTDVTSNNLGEIEPSKVSFHGEKYYNNNFTIDGLSNNNNIDPAGNSNSNSGNGYGPTDLPAGGAQTFWISSDLIGSFEAFDSNISAKYGDFTGGVVNAKLKDPDLKRTSGRVSYRTTRDSWVDFYVSDPESFALANTISKQPKYTKNSYSLTLNQPVTDKFGLLFNYSRQESDIPYWHTNLQKWEDRKRLNENYLLKGVYHADNGDNIRGTLIYAPHTSTNVKQNVLNGAFDNEGGGYRFNLEWDRPTAWGKVNSIIAYQFDQNNIKHESDEYSTWYTVTTSGSPTNFYGLSSANTVGIGGYGEYATEKKSITVKQDYEFTPTNYGKFVEASWILGWDFKNEQAKYERFRDVYLNTQATRSASITCADGDSLCYAGQQYVRNRRLYPMRSVEADIIKYGAYAEAKLKIGRVELVPGVRMDYDDYMQNVNIAPRFSMTVDVFNNNRTKLFGGVNRYYKDGVLAYKMREGITSFYTLSRTLSRNTLSDWTSSDLSTASIQTNDVSGLKSPYSDEVNIGITQEMFNTLWTLKWVKREGKNQFARETTARDANNRRYYQMTNAGRTSGETFALTINPLQSLNFDYVNMDWSLTAAHRKNKSSASTDYDSSEDDNMVIYNGKLINPEDMEALDFNTPWTVTASSRWHFPKVNIRWTHDLTYTAGSESFSSSSGNCPAYNTDICGNYTGAVREYVRYKQKPAFTYDWRFDYRLPTFKNQNLEIGVDILNILNRKIIAEATTSSSTVTYKPGREFWLNVAYNF